MTHEEYIKALEKLLEVQTLLKKIEFDTKGKRSERAVEGIKKIIETKTIIIDLYEGASDDEN